MNVAKTPTQGTHESMPAQNEKTRLTGLVAVLFQPLRERLQRVINRLIYGERDEPYTVVTRLSQRLAVALAPDAVLPTLVEREVLEVSSRGTCLAHFDAAI